MKDEDEITREERPRSSGRQEPDRNFRISTRENAAFKWKKEKSVVGALELHSYPTLDPHKKLQEHVVMTVQDKFTECLNIWNHEKLQKSLVAAVESVPPVIGCCGLVRHEDATIKEVARTLNERWAKSISEQHFHAKGYKLSLFVWTWNNLSGAAQNVVLLIRFHTYEADCK